MTVPKNPKPGPMPVVIFGHGLVTERRFVLAVGDALAAKGYAAISIDFPYHGDRTYCATGGPISVVNPLDRPAASLDPCQSGSTCNDRRPVRRCERQRQPPRDVRRDLDAGRVGRGVPRDRSHREQQGSLPAGARRSRRARSLAAQGRLAAACSATPSTRRRSTTPASRSAGSWARSSSARRPTSRARCSTCRAPA